MHTPTAFILRCAASPPPPPPTFTLPISPLPSPSFPHPLTIARPHTLSRYISFLPSSFLPAICSLFVSASPPPCLSWLLFCHCAPLRAFLLASSYIERLYIEPDIVRFFYTYTSRCIYIYIFTILDPRSLGIKIIWLD